jgi:hypothetical protein
VLSRSAKIEEGGVIVRRLSCVVTVVVVVLLTLGLGVAGAQNQPGNEAPLKQSAQQPILQEQPTKEQVPQDQGAQQQQQQGVRTLPIRALVQVSVQDTSFAPAHSRLPAAYRDRGRWVLRLRNVESGGAFFARFRGTRDAHLPLRATPRDGGKRHRW